MEGLGIDPLQLGAQIVNVVILIILLNKFLYKPVLAMLDKRTRDIREGLTLKDKMETLKEDLKEERKKLKSDAHREEQRIVKVAIEEAKTKKQQLLDEAKMEIVAEREKMLADMSREREKMLEQAKQQSMQYAILISEKLLGQKLNVQGQEKLLKEALTDLEKN